MWNPIKVYESSCLLPSIAASASQRASRNKRTSSTACVYLHLFICKNRTLRRELQHIQTKYHNTPLLQPLQLVLLPLDPPSETRRSRRALKLHPLRQRGESLHPKLPHRPLARHGIQGTNLWAMLLAVSVVTTIQLAQDDKCRRILRLW